MVADGNQSQYDSEFLWIGVNPRLEFLGGRERLLRVEGSLSGRLVRPIAGLHSAALRSPDLRIWNEGVGACGIAELYSANGNADCKSALPGGFQLARGLIGAPSASIRGLNSSVVVNGYRLR